MHINWLEIRAVILSFLMLAVPGDVVQFHIDNMMAIAFIRMMEGTHCPSLYKESLWLWQQAIRTELTILLPLWHASEDN